MTAGFLRCLVVLSRWVSVSPRHSFGFMLSLSILQIRDLNLFKLDPLPPIPPMHHSLFPLLVDKKLVCASDLSAFCSCSLYVSVLPASSLFWRDSPHSATVTTDSRSAEPINLRWTSSPRLEFKTFLRVKCCLLIYQHLCTESQSAQFRLHIVCIFTTCQVPKSSFY